MLWSYRTQAKSEARMLTSTQIENVTTEELERLRVRIEAELEGRRGAKERDNESAVEVLRATRRPLALFSGRCGNAAIRTAATSARAARGTARVCIGSTIATGSAIASTFRLRRRVP